MNDDRWRRIEQLYQTALDLPDAERAAFLDRECVGDSALRQEVASLIALQPAATDFLEQPAIDMTAKALADILPAPAAPIVPGYRIVRELGEGGMGVVYLAEQEAPLRRPVALKVIRPGMDSRQVVARFNVERQAMALMDHPNIAAIHGAGTTADGRPYFVMEFVDGPSIVEYCDRHRLPTRARLKLFTEICAGVQHAHQKGVIHRDLKPSNVLVAEQDGRPVPKVIDFGTVKAVDRTQDGAISLTAQGMALGTVEYMSPEQAAFSRDIDTTTDVYSLGVMLYELLVGVLPFESPRPGLEGYDELRRLIRESDPAKPSTRLAGVGPAPDAIAAARQTDPDRLNRALRGDFDWITLKALEKERTRRYPTVAAMEADIRRFLADEPIEARPPSAAYRLRKFTRRHRGAVAAATAVVGVLGAGMIATTAMYVRAERASADANQQRAAATAQREHAEMARIAAEHATVEANSQRQAALNGNAATAQQSLLTTREAERARVALRESEYRNFVITIAAADADLREGSAVTARERLLAVPERLRGWEWHHLRLRSDLSLYRLEDPAPCSMLELYAIDRLILGAGAERIAHAHCGRVNWWNMRTGVRTAAPLPTQARFLATAAGRLLVAAPRASGWTLSVLDSASTAPHVIGAVDREPVCGALSPDGVTIVVGLDSLFFPNGQQEELFEVWNVRDARQTHRLFPPKLPLPDLRDRVETTCAVRFNLDGSLVATSGTSVQIWDAATGRERHRDPGQAGKVAQPIAFSHDGTKLAIGRRTGLIDVLDVTPRAVSMRTLDGGQILQPISTTDVNRLDSLKSQETRAVAFSPDGRWVVSGFSNRIGVWDLSNARLIKVLDGHTAPVSGVAVSASDVINSADLSGTVRVWPLASTVGITRLEGNTGYGITAAVSNHTIIAGSADGSLVVWREGEHRPQALAVSAAPQRIDQVNGVSEIVMTRDGSVALVTTGTLMRGSNRRWFLAPPVRSEPLSFATSEPGCGDKKAIEHAALSRDGRYLASEHNGCVIVRDLTTQTTVARLDPSGRGEPELEPATNILFGPRGVLLVATSQRERLGGPPFGRRWLIWDWQNSHVREFHRRTGQATDVRLPPIGVSSRWKVSADGSRVALSEYERDTVAIWNSTLTREVSRMPVPVLSHIALSPDGRRLATSRSDERLVRVWDTETGQLLLKLDDIDTHAGPPTFTHDGRLAAARSGGGFTIWETRKSPCPACPSAR